MKNSLTRAIIVLVVLVTSAVLLSNGKYLNIGECRWYTEQYDFPDILAIAKKRANPVLAVYSASWCGPCQDFIKNILTVTEFQTVEKEAVLLFIEFTTEAGKKLVEKHKVSKFPTLKLFSTRGAELDTELPGDSVDSILQWVRQTKVKEKYLNRLEKNPADWEALFKATEQRKKSLYSSDQYESTISLLRKALAVTKDDGSLDRQRAYERLADYLYLTMINKQGERRRKYALEHNEEFTRIIRAYYPAKFRYDLKGHNPLARWIDWLIAAGNHREAITIFEDSPATLRKDFDPYKDINLLGSIIKSYLYLNQEKKTGVWLDKIDKSYETNLKKAGLQSPPLTYLKILLDMIEYTHTQGNKPGENKYIDKLLKVLADTGDKVDHRVLYKSFPDFEKIIDFFYRRDMKAEVNKIAAILNRMINSFDDENYQAFASIRLAKRYGVFVEEALKKLYKKKKIMFQGGDTYLVVNSAVLLSKKGEHKRAYSLIIGKYEQVISDKKIDKNSLSNTLNNLAWALVEMGAIDRKSLEIAQKSVELDKNGHNLDTLATIYAGLGNFRDAVKTGRIALQLTASEDEQIMIEEKLENWQKELNLSNNKKNKK